MGPQVERQRRDNQGAEGCEEGGVGVSLSTGGEVWVGLCPPPQNCFLNFYIKIVSFCAFWVAISYRLADCYPNQKYAWN